MMKRDAPCALITGGTRGIGAATARRLAASGYQLILAYREREADAARLATELAGNTLIVRCDVTDRMAVRSMIDVATQRFGGIDLLINSAGLLQQVPFEQQSDHDWQVMLDVNLRATFVVIQESSKTLRQGGSIVNLSSVGGQVGGTLAAHYAAAKAGVVSLTKSVARIYAPRGIRCNCVAPGLIATEMTEDEIASADGQRKIRNIPLGRVGSPEEIAAAIAFLGSNAARYITGQVLNVNGGMY